MKQEERNLFHYTGCGLGNVYLRNGYTERDTPYGKGVAIHNLEGLHREIGLFLVQNRPNLTGSEARFLRKELDMPQSDLAAILGISENTVRGWENSRTKISGPAERMLRVLYREQVLGDGKVREIVDRLAKLNRDAYRERIELEETENGWLAAA